MKKKFAKYEVGSADPDQLIEFELRNLFRQASELQMLRRSGSGTVEVDVEEFEARARAVSKVDDLAAFFASANFVGFARARNAEAREVIIREADQAAFGEFVARQAAAAAAPPQQAQEVAA
jgi:hypothetical protein